MADIRYQNTSVKNDSELDVLLALKENIFKNLKVGSFGQVKKVNEEDNTASVVLFPAYKNNIEISINVTICKNLVIKEDDVVVILFLDTNFKQSLRQTLKQQKRSSLDTSIVEMHSINYGVVIASMSRSDIDIESITNREIDILFNNIY